MFRWRRQAQPEPGQVLERALAAPDPGAVCLVSELFINGEAPSTILVTAPDEGPAAAILAGSLAAAAARLDGRPTLLIDLRPRRSSPGAGGGDDGHVVVVVPDDQLAGRHIELARRLGDLSRRYDRCIYLCGSVLDPAAPAQDPVSWRSASARVVLACRAGHTDDQQVRTAAERLRRAGLTVVGGVLITGEPTVAGPATRWREQPLGGAALASAGGSA